MTAEDIKLVRVLQNLPENYWDFRDADTREYTHGIHNYPAMMVSPISRNIIRIVREIQPVTALFDPFAGSGTVLVEGMLANLPTVAGNDINPLALLLSKAKTTPLQPQHLRTACQNLMNDIDTQRGRLQAALRGVDAYITDTLGLDVTERKNWGEQAERYLAQYCAQCHADIVVPTFKNIGYWFKPRVILELSVIKSAIGRISDADMRDYALVAFSETVRIVSNRRNGEFKMFRMPPEQVAAFQPNVVAEFQRILLRNIEKMEEFVHILSVRKANTNVRIYANNACTLEEVPNGAFDLIITSPPYGDSRTTVAYGEFSRLSLQWTDLPALSERQIMEIDKSLLGGRKFRNGFACGVNSQTLRGSLEKISEQDIERAGDVYSFYEDLERVIESVAAKTKRGGYHFWVVGNRTVKKELLKTDVIISEIAAHCGLETVCIVDRNIPNKVMPSRNSPSNVAGETNTTMTREHIVVLRKT